MQYKILASDYDNTLMPFGEAKPRPAVVKAVKKLQAAGGKFVPGIRDKNQLGGIRYDYAITCNGACVVDRQGNVIAEHPLTSEEMYVLVDFCEDYNYPLQFNFRDAYYAYCEYEYLHAGYQMMNSPGLDCVDGRTGIWWICPTPPLPPCRRRKWSASTKNTATLACTGCRWARRTRTATATTISCAAVWIRA